MCFTLLYACCLQVALGSYCETVDLVLHEETGEQMLQKLSKLPGLAAAPVQVTKSGDAANGWKVTVTFDPVRTPGDLPQLRVADATGVTGKNLVISSISLRNGTTDLFLAPIPTEITRLAVAQPNTVEVVVNGVPAACSNPAACTFGYTQERTANITAVNPSVVSVVSVCRISFVSHSCMVVV